MTRLPLQVPARIGIFSLQEVILQHFLLGGQPARDEADIPGCFKGPLHDPAERLRSNDFSRFSMNGRDLSLEMIAPVVFLCCGRQKKPHIFLPRDSSSNGAGQAKQMEPICLSPS
jgi:hypothetical protein